MPALLRQITVRRQCRWQFSSISFKKIRILHAHYLQWHVTNSKNRYHVIWWNLIRLVTMEASIIEILLSLALLKSTTEETYTFPRYSSPLYLPHPDTVKYKRTKCKTTKRERFHEFMLFFYLFVYVYTVHGIVLYSYLAPSSFLSETFHLL